MMKMPTMIAVMVVLKGACQERRASSARYMNMIYVHMNFQVIFFRNTYNNNDDAHNDSCDGGVEWEPGEERIIRAQQGREAAGHRVSKTDTNVIYHG